MVCECDLLSELWLSLCLALSTTVPCLNGSLPRQRSKTAQIRAQLK